jgi:hypothetical protein
MSNRIEELVTATDAWCDQNFPPDWTDRVDEFLPLWNAKFAELIIQECAKIGEIKEQGFGDYDPNISVGWYMRKHFGFSLRAADAIRARERT